MTIKAVFLLPLLLLAAPPATAQQAQQTRQFCEEGRTRDGQCVNADAAEMGRKEALLSTQAKISMTAPPVMPDDPAQPYAYNHAEIKAFFIDRLSRHGLTPIGSRSPVPCNPGGRVVCR